MLHICHLLNSLLLFLHIKHHVRESNVEMVERKLPLTSALRCPKKGLLRTEAPTFVSNNHQCSAHPQRAPCLDAEPPVLYGTPPNMDLICLAFLFWMGKFHCWEFEVTQVATIGLRQLNLVCIVKAYEFILQM